jgi:hypothetical protein
LPYLNRYIFASLPISGKFINKTRKMKKLLLLSLSMLAVSPFLVPTAPAKAAFQGPDGYVEQVTASGEVKGWFYQNDQPEDIEVVFQNVNNTTDYRRYIINPQQASNKISYFTQRADVKAYLMKKYKNPTFKYPQGFLLTGKYLPVGQWRLTSVSGANIFGGGEIPMTSGNRVANISYSAPYVEGYVDSTTGGNIKGWAYDSGGYGGSYVGPDIYLKIRNVKSGATQEFSFGSNEEATLISRSARQDVISFLTHYRGQHPNYFDYPSVAKSGFSINLSASSHPVAAGTWEIVTLTMDGSDIPFGNTNPSHVMVIQ